MQNMRNQCIHARRPVLAMSCYLKIVADAIPKNELACFHESLLSHTLVAFHIYFSRHTLVGVYLCASFVKK